MTDKCIFGGAAVALCLALAACQSGGESAAGSNTRARLLPTVPFPSSYGEHFDEAAEVYWDPKPLTSDEIETIYTGVSEHYDDHAQPGIRVDSVYSADGRMEYEWSFRGEVREGTGRWYARDGQLCIDYDAVPPTPDTPDPNCRRINGVRGNQSSVVSVLNESGYAAGMMVLRPIP